MARSRNFAADFGVGLSTVSDWVKSKSKLEEHSSKMPNRKTMKTAEYEKTERGPLVVLHSTAGKGDSFVGVDYSRKSENARKNDGGGGGVQCKCFTESSGWLDKWKTRYGIRHFNICDEKLSADEGAVNVSKTEFEHMIQGYTRDQIFNAEFQNATENISQFICNSELFKFHHMLATFNNQIWVCCCRLLYVLLKKVRSRHRPTCY
jgi:argonaute-like protein implicated in RNA metabolism and viral defense